MKKIKRIMTVLAFFVVSLILFVAISTGCVEACLVSVFRLDTLNEIVEGLVVASIVALIYVLKPPLPAWLHRPIAPHFSRRLVTALALSGVFVYVLFAVVDATYYSFASSYESGILASLVWCLTVLCVAFRTGIVRAIRIFGLPSIVFSMCLLLFSNYLQMTSSLSNLIKWDLNLRGWNDIPLVSNWFVLTVVAFLCAREVATHFQTVPSEPCGPKCCLKDCLCEDCPNCMGT